MGVSITPETVPKIRIAVIGTGIIGPKHAQCVADNSDTILCAVVDPGSHGEAIAKQFNAAYYTSVETLLSSPDCPDAAIVCTPNHTHVSISKQLAARGVHLLVEKPICDEIDGAREIIEAANAARIKLLVGHHRRFNPYIQAAKSALKTLGDVTMVNGLWATQKADAYFDGFGTWHRGSSAGPILINMIHEIDALQYLLGPISQVKAERALSRRGHEAEEGGVLIMRFENGIVGSFAFCDNVPSPYNFESGVGEDPFPHTGMDFYRIFGSKASLSLPDMRRWSYDRSEEKSWWGELTQDVIPVKNEAPAFQLQMAHFVRVIRGEEEPRCSGEEGLRALVVAKAVQRSLESNTVIQIDGFL